MSALGRCAAVLVAAAGLALAPSVASAARVAAIGGKLQFTAAPGETNTVGLAQAGGSFTVTDTTALITPGQGCTPGAPSHQVTCPTAGVTAAVFALGDANDALAVDRKVTVGALGLGEEGSDTLSGGSRADTLLGAAGDDTVDGRGGADDLRGGDGVDTVSYASRVDPLSVSLDGKPDDGEAGENDSVAEDIENITGGAGNDRLLGDAADNRLLGNGGNDLLEGMSRTDTMDGGGGSDSVSYAERTNPVNISLDNVANDGAPGENDSIARVENVIGGASADTLTGDANANGFIPSGGDDAVSGLGGADRLS